MDAKETRVVTTVFNSYMGTLRSFRELSVLLGLSDLVAKFDEAQEIIQSAWTDLGLSPPLRLVRDGDEGSDDDDWRSFIDGHPELTEPPTHFCDDELVEALREAIAEWDAYLAASEPGREPSGAVAAHEVARRLMPSAQLITKNRDGKNRATGPLLRVGKALSRLADEGRVIRLRPKWGTGGNLYSLAGFTIGEWPLRYRRIDDAR